MSNFSVNQVHQFYFGSAYNASVTAGSDAGTIGAVKAITEGQDKEFYFLVKGADTVLKSDFIQLKNLNCIKAYKASDMVIPMKKIKVVLDSSINSGNPIAGQDYILGINFKNFFSSGDDSQYYKDCAVHATAAMEADKKEFYKAMVAALNAAFAREYGATATSNPYLEFSAGTPASEDGIYIQEKPQEWQLGTKKARRIYFDVFPGTVYTGGDDVIWGTQTDLTPAKADAVVGTNAIGNGQQIADLEWFCMGERGDQYRGVGWPNVIPTKYLVDPTKQYNVLEFHYAFTDTGVNSYRTEKEITVVFPLGATDHEYDQINAFIGAINSATSLSIATLSD